MLRNIENFQAGKSWVKTRGAKKMTHIRTVRKSHYGLKFGDMMQCTMKRITIQRGPPSARQIWCSMELSTPVVVQHHIHSTLTLDFQGQILKMLYLRNGRADWLGTKGMLVNGMLDPHCDFELWPHPWPWPPGLNLGFSNSIFEIAVSIGNERNMSR